MLANIVLCVTFWPHNPRPVVAHIGKLTGADKMATSSLRL